MRVVIDTNVLISAVLFPFSKPRKAFDISLENGKILISNETFSELKRILLKEKFDKYADRDLRKAFLSEFLTISQKIKIERKVEASRDKKDNQFLDVAVNGKADYIISGDQDLLVLHPFENVEILNPHDFIEKL